MRVISLNHGSAASSTSSTSHEHCHCYHQRQHAANEPILTNCKRSCDLEYDLQRHPVPLHAQLPVAMTSPPLYWPATSPAGVMTSHDDVAPPGDCSIANYQRNRHCCHQQQEACPDDVTSPIYVEKIVAELIETERTYVAELQQVVQVMASAYVYLSITVCLSICLSA